jgi:hypothetical protein
MALFRAGTGYQGTPGGVIPSIPEQLSSFWNYNPFTPQFQAFVKTYDWRSDPALARETQNFISGLAAIEEGEMPFAPWPSGSGAATPKPETAAEQRRQGLSAVQANLDPRPEWVRNYEALFGPLLPGRGGFMSSSENRTGRMGYTGAGLAGAWEPPFGTIQETDISEDIFFPQYLLMQGISPGALEGGDIRQGVYGGRRGDVIPAEFGRVSRELIGELESAEERTGSFLIRGGHVSKGRRAGLIPV